MKKIKLLFIATIVTFPVLAQIPGTNIWNTSDATIIGNGGVLYEPYLGYNTQNNRTIQLFGENTQYGIPSLTFIKTYHGKIHAGSLMWVSDNFTTSDRRFAQIGAKLTNKEGRLNFMTRKESDPTGQFNQMVLDEDGNVGIGTTNPIYKLDVDGTINASNILVNGNPINSPTSLWVIENNNINYSLGKVGIGTSTPDEKLTVKGKIHSEEVRVDLNVPGPDYVFEPNYNLTTLQETKVYIQRNKHLPEVPSAKEMEANGIELGEMNILLLKKIEELTLHLINQNEELTAQKKEIQALKVKLNNLD